MLFFLILLPVMASGIVFVLSNHRLRNSIVLAMGIFHLAIVVSFWKMVPPPELKGFLAVDSLGLLVLSIVSLLFLASAFYSFGYLKPEDIHSNRILQTCILIFLSSMTVVTLSQDFGLSWIAIEASTLSSAPLINFHRSPQSVEATWKYLLICSVGIALALLGTLFLAVSATEIKTLILSDLLSHASALSIPWFKLSVIFLLVGYGTKMGLAPMHTWKPDAYGQAPGPVAALMSGGLTNCAFLVILRVSQICQKANQTEFFSSILIVLAIFSLVIAAIFILGQKDYMRMFAYSSVEHAGILVLGIALGGIGLYASLFHCLNNALSKGVVFLTAGNIYQKFQSKRVGDIQGLFSSSPRTGVLLMIGFLATTGIPPFATFQSELMILSAILSGHHFGLAVIYLLCLAIIFIGMAASVLKMVQGVPLDLSRSKADQESLFTIIPPVVLAVMVLALGLYMPTCLDKALRASSLLLGG